MGLLDEIIDGAASDGVSTTNLLRRVRTLAFRVGASELSAWSLSELNGYAIDAPLPNYRGPFGANVTGQWSGPFNTGGMGAVSSIGVPADMTRLFRHEFRQGVAEIEDLARRDSEMGMPWDPYAVGRYNELIDKNQVSHIDGMGLVSATIMVTPALLRSIVESVRTRALELALDLQAADPSAGEAGGATVSDAAIQSAVVQITNHIYGDGANVAQGAGITQTSSVTKGDIAELASGLSELLADPAAIGKAIAIITSDDAVPEKKSKLEKLGQLVRDGAVSLAAGVTTDMAASGLLTLASQFLGW